MNMEKDERISAFAFRIGAELEKLVQQEVEKIKSENTHLESLVLQWYLKTKDEAFAEHFKITTCRDGRV